MCKFSVNQVHGAELSNRPLHHHTDKTYKSSHLRPFRIKKTLNKQLLNNIQKKQTTKTSEDRREKVKSGSFLMGTSDVIHLFGKSELQQVLVCNKPCGTSLLALVESSETVPLRPLPPPTVHFKIRVPALALVLWDLLADAGLRLHRSDVGAGFLRGQRWCWSRLGFES